jgi:Ca2+-binding RTX toxin-like protein
MVLVYSSSGGSQRDLLFGGAGADIMQAGSEERFWFRDTLRREPEGGTNAQHGAAT